MRRVPAIFRNVDARLDGDAVAGLQRDTPRDGGAVMHVQANIVTDVMIEQPVDVSKRRREAELLQLGGDADAGFAMDVVERIIRRLAAERDAAPLDTEESLVQVSLRGRELAVLGPHARDVADVVSVLAARVDEDERVGRDGGVVEDVVDAEGVFPSRDDGDEGEPRAAGSLDVVFEGYFYVSLEGPLAAHEVGDGAAGEATRLTHVGDFGFTFDKAEGVHQGG